MTNEPQAGVKMVANLADARNGDEASLIYGSIPEVERDQSLLSARRTMP